MKHGLLNNPEIFFLNGAKNFLLSYRQKLIKPIQLQRKPRPFPRLHIKRPVERIEDFTMEDFEIQEYKPYPKIAMEMAV